MKTKIVDFNFIGDYSNAEFGEGRTQDKKRESSRVWNPGAAKAHIGIATGFGAVGGYGLGKSSNRNKLMKQGLSVSSPQVRAGSGWKRKLAGAAITSAVLGGGTYLTHKIDPRSPIGKKNERDNPYTQKQREKDKVWSPKAAIAIGSTLGGTWGYNAGKYLNMRKAAKAGDVVGVLEGNIKGGWKTKLAGSVIAGGTFAGLGYLAHKDKIIKPKDINGRSDKGKKRLKRF